MLFPWASGSSLLWTCPGARWSRCDEEARQWKLQALVRAPVFLWLKQMKHVCSSFWADSLTCPTGNGRWINCSDFVILSVITFPSCFHSLCWADQSLVKQTPSLRISMIILSRLEAVIKRSCVSSANNTPYANSTLRQAERVHWIVFSQWVWLFAALTNED